MLRYVGAGRKPKADDRAIRRKRRYVINPEGVYNRWGPTGPIGQPPKGVEKKKKFRPK